MLATGTTSRKPARFQAEPGGLTEEQLAQFHKEGYVVIDGLLDPTQDIAPIIAEYAMVLDRLAQELFDAGQISSTYADLPFSDRLTKVYAESGKVHAQYFDFSLPQTGVTHDTPHWTGPAVFAALRHPGILDAIESIIGGEIYANPVQHVRMKPPEHLTPVDPNTGMVQLGASPWHQDNGVVTEDADETEIITVWFPLTDATVENGCLAVVPRHDDEGLFTHCPSGLGLHIPEDQFRVQERDPAANAQGVGAVHAPPDAAPLVLEQQRSRPLELRSSVQPDRSADGPGGLPRLHRPQPATAGSRAPRPEGMDPPLARDPRHHGRV